MIGFVTAIHQTTISCPVSTILRETQCCANKKKGTWKITDVQNAKNARTRGTWKTQKMYKHAIFVDSQVAKLSVTN